MGAQRAREREREARRRVRGHVEEDDVVERGLVAQARKRSCELAFGSSVRLLALVPIGAAVEVAAADAQVNRPVHDRLVEQVTHRAVRRQEDARVDVRQRAVLEPRQAAGAVEAVHPGPKWVRAYVRVRRSTHPDLARIVLVAAVERDPERILLEVGVGLHEQHVVVLLRTILRLVQQVDEAAPALILGPEDGLKLEALGRIAAFAERHRVHPRPRPHTM
eukprot:7361289-Prymnesium_polylepis.2